MATNQQIEQWKQEHGFIYKAVIDGKDYVFKTLSRDDYMVIQTKVQEAGPGFDNELEVVSVCLLEPKLSPVELKAKAGLISVLSEKIMARSGFLAVVDEEL